MKIQTVKKYFWTDSPHSKNPSETVEHALAQVRGSGLNIFDDLKDISEFGTNAIPIYHVSSGVSGNEWGKGLTHDQSKASAVMERIERYSAVHSIKTRQSSLKLAPRVDLQERSLSLDDLTASNLQHYLYKDLGSIDNLEVLWTRVSSLTLKDQLWVPASRAFFGCKQPIIKDFMCSNGLSANNTIEEAIIQGLSELIERHIYHLHYMNINRPAPTRIDFSDLHSDTLARVIEDLISSGYLVIANYHPTPLPFCTVSVLLFNPSENHTFDNGGCYVHFGTASNPEVALARCITECIQSMAAEKFRGRGLSMKPTIIPRRVRQELEWRLKEGRVVKVSGISHFQFDDFLDDLNMAISTLEKIGHEVLVSELTHEKIGIPVVRVICPGLQPNFLLLGKSIHSARSAISKYVDRHELYWKNAREGNFA